MVGMKIAIQGSVGSFHHIAAEHYYQIGQEYIYCENFSDVFLSLTGGKADVGVVAIENSMYGSINEVYDLLQIHRFPIVGEVVEHIRQNLIGFQGTPLESITKVYSHPVALAQCADFLEHHLPQAEIIEYHDTAAAVEFIKQHGEHSAAAIASNLAANLNEMSILRPGIQDERDNYTRFLAIDPRADETTSMTSAEPNKASLVLITSHEPGALYAALGVFAGLDCNLTKLQSRPITGKVWQYQFYVDVEILADKLEEAIRKLSEQECTVIHLGSYHAAEQQFDD
jgi:prephenate dehydratase